MRRAIIEIDSDAAHLLKEALSPEAQRAIPRTVVKVLENGSVLTIDIQAQDVNALRAAINSYLRWVTVGMGTADLAPGK
jgi:tRNA threonylcarbamoyladenosine modification (KEOPS) complex  Pcc1 subunit